MSEEDVKYTGPGSYFTHSYTWQVAYQHQLDNELSDRYELTICCNTPTVSFQQLLVWFENIGST